jgi:hypothetical protein
MFVSYHITLTHVQESIDSLIISSSSYRGCSNGTTAVHEEQKGPSGAGGGFDRARLRWCVW